MKKFLTSALSFAMMLGTLSIAHAQVAETDWSEGITQTGSQIVIPAGLAGGAYSNQFKGDLITSEEKSYEMIIDLNSDYAHGELFSLSLGLGKDADTYTNEYLVMTQKNGDQFTITSGVFEDSEPITVSKPGLYTYTYTVSKTDLGIQAEFSIPELGITRPFKTVNDDSECIRYFWAFGRDVAGEYVLDRDLTLYTAKPTIEKVTVVDGTDGVTTVSNPYVGQKLTANVTLDNGTTVGSYPVDPYLQYTWYYEGTDTVLGTDPVYTVTSDNLGKTIACRITGGNSGYAGEVVWEANRAVVNEEDLPVNSVVSVQVVDGEDGYTPVTQPVVGQKLTANITMEDGTTVGSYPVDENVEYVWSYEGSDTVLGTGPVYTVTEDNLGKVITVTVTGVNTYDGEATWTAEDVVILPEEPEEPVKDMITVTLVGVVDGEVLSDTTEVVEVEKGSILTDEIIAQLNEIAKSFDVEGYEFDGFFYDQEGTDRLASNDVLDQDTTIYLIWSTKQATPPVDDGKDEPTQPTEEEKPEELVQTGDNNMIMLFAGMALVSGGLLVALNKKRLFNK